MMKCTSFIFILHQFKTQLHKSPNLKSKAGSQIWTQHSQQQTQTSLKQPITSRCLYQYYIWRPIPCFKGWTFASFGLSTERALVSASAVSHCEEFIIELHVFPIFVNHKVTGNVNSDSDFYCHLMNCDLDFYTLSFDDWDLAYEYDSRGRLGIRNVKNQSLLLLSKDCALTSVQHTENIYPNSVNWSSIWGQDSLKSLLHTSVLYIYHEISRAWKRLKNFKDPFSNTSK